ncbi:hypothetical protein AgCh_040294 [Apium graveolens]
MTVRETLELSGRCQGFGFKQDHESNHIEFDTDMLMELLRREKDLGIEPDDDLDTFVKSIALGDQRTGLVVDYIMKIVGIDDLKKEVDKKGKDEAVTSRTSQSSPRETARKGGIFRKQDIDSLFMEVSQPVADGVWATAVENAFGIYTPCVDSVVIFFSYALAMGLCLYRIWRLKKDLKVQRFHLRSNYYNYVLGLLAVYCTTEPLFRLITSISAVNLDGQNGLVPFEVGNPVPIMFYIHGFVC